MDLKEGDAIVSVAIVREGQLSRVMGDEGDEEATEPSQAPVASVPGAQ